MLCSCEAVQTRVAITLLMIPLAIGEVHAQTSSFSVSNASKDTLLFVGESGKVMLTVAEEDRSLFDAIKAGAHGYLLKKMEPDEFLAMVHGISRGEAPISRAMASKILGEFGRRVKGQAPEDPAAKLTPREHEVLQLLTQGRTNKEIANTLCVSENTIKNHLKNILAKLHLQNRVQAVAYALREGIVPDEPQRPKAGPA